MITQAFVLGAGLGTRLRPLTEDLPKPLIPIFQKPLITFVFDHLIDAGVKSFVVNTHHRADAFRQFFSEGQYRGCPVRLVHEPEILGTGGGIKNVESLLGEEHFISYSGDLLTDIEIAPVLEEHFRAGNDVTIALRETRHGADVALEGNRVVDMVNRYGHEGRYDFAGIAVWARAIFDRAFEAARDDVTRALLLDGRAALAQDLSDLVPAEADARAAIDAAAAETGLVVDDPVRFGADRLLDAVLAAFAR